VAKWAAISKLNYIVILALLDVVRYITQIGQPQKCHQPLSLLEQAIDQNKSLIWFHISHIRAIIQNRLRI